MVSIKKIGTAPIGAVGMIVSAPAGAEGTITRRRKRRVKGRKGPKGQK